MMSLSHLLLAATAALAQSELGPEEFARLHEMIKPQPGEALWAEVPWLTRLTEARRKAAAEGKPILIWMAGGGGNPIGQV